MAASVLCTISGRLFLVARVPEQTTREREGEVKRRCFLGLPLIAFGAASRRVWAGAGGPDNQYVKTIGWFTAMFRPLEDLADVVDRLRLLRYLRGLASVCDAMTTDKAEIANLLAQKPLHRDELSSLLDRLRANVGLTRVRVGLVRSVLREEFSKKGEYVSEELSDNLASRKSWVLELQSRIPSAPDEQLSSFAERATASKEALKAVTLKLSELVQFLDPPRQHDVGGR